MPSFLQAPCHRLAACGRCTGTHTHARTHTHACTHTNTHRHACIHTRTHTHMHARIHKRTQTHACTHTRIHTVLLRPRQPLAGCLQHVDSMTPCSTPRLTRKLHGHTPSAHPALGEQLRTMQSTRRMATYSQTLQFPRTARTWKTALGGPPAASCHRGATKKAVILAVARLVTVTGWYSDALRREQVPNSREVVSTVTADTGSCAVCVCVCHIQYGGMRV